MAIELHIEHDDFDLFVDGQKVLHIGQVSDENTINLFFYPEKATIVESIMHKEDKDSECTHELLAIRNGGDTK